MRPAARSLEIPAKVTRVFPAGPPAAIMLYTMAPDLLIGWPRANRPEEREFLLPDIGSRPEVGRITGRGNTANLEMVLALKPDLILDVGSTSETFVSLATRVQEQTGIPYALLDGRFVAIANSYRTLGALTGRRAQGEDLADYTHRTITLITERIANIPARAAPACLLRARSARARNRSWRLDQCRNHRIDCAQRRGRTPGRARHCVDRAGAGLESGRHHHHRSGFRGAREKRSGLGRRRRGAAGRVHLSPKLPFGWVDFPPSVNRLIGLWWLAKILYPERFPEDLVDADARFLPALLSCDAERRADRARAGGAGVR